MLVVFPTGSSLCIHEHDCRLQYDWPDTGCMSQGGRTYKALPSVNLRVRGQTLSQQSTQTAQKRTFWSFNTKIVVGDCQNMNVGNRDHCTYGLHIKQLMEYQFVRSQSLLSTLQQTARQECPLHQTFVCLSVPCHVCLNIICLIGPLTLPGHRSQSSTTLNW